MEITTMLVRARCGLSGCVKLGRKVASGSVPRGIPPACSQNSTQCPYTIFILGMRCDMEGNPLPRIFSLKIIWKWISGGLRPRSCDPTALDTRIAAPRMWSMIDRRGFCLSASATLFAPRVVGANSNDLRTAIASLRQLHSLQISRGADMVFAEAPRGPGLDRLANIKSCSKSIVALLLGSVIDRGEISSVTATLGQIAPGILPGNATPGAAAITMEDLVTLRAGLERTSGPNYGAWTSSRNWLADALSRPMVAEPGTRMLYSTGSTHILGASLAEATGRSLLELARERLGAPLGIDIPAWTRDPQGYYLGGNEMGLSPSAMLKIAMLMRDRGRFDGEQVLSEDWITKSTKPYARSPWSGLSYGYGWFLSPSGYVLGRGYGGQIIAAHPGRDLAVAVTSDPTQPARSDGYFGDLMRLLDGPVLAISQNPVDGR